MTTSVVTIPKEDYELLLKCKHIVESEFEEKFSEEFIKAVKASERAYRDGEYVIVKSSQERRKLFDSL